MVSYTIVFALLAAKAHCLSIAGKGHSKPAANDDAISPIEPPVGDARGATGGTAEEQTVAAVARADGNANTEETKQPEVGAEDEVIDVQNFDLDGDGVVSMQEFQQGVDRVNQEQLEQQQQRADAENNVVDVENFDANGDGVVSLEEFQRGVAQVNERQRQRKRRTILGCIDAPDCGECPSCGIPESPILAMPQSMVNALTDVDVEVSVLPQCCACGASQGPPRNEDPERSFSEEVKEAMEAFREAEKADSPSGSLGSKSSSSSSRGGTTNIALINLDFDIDIEPVTKCCSCNIFTYLKAKIEALRNGLR